MIEATELAYAGAAEQARIVRDGDASAREVVEATLRRIERLDPLLNAYRVVFAERALAEAGQADARRAAGQERPLLGVPVAIKDDTDIAGEITAWGGAGDPVPKRADADVVTRLRAAGAVIVGKTSVPEMTMWPWTASVTFGAARNPFATDRTPGGSSGGSAAAVAAGMCGVALGSDGAGSIRGPAGLCGLFGIKPQRDRISLGPDRHDAWEGLTVYGPIARGVRDAALFLDATADGAPEGGFLGALGEEVGPLRIAVSLKPPIGSLTRIDPERRRAIEATAELLRSLGHDVFEHEVDYGPQTMLNVMVRYLRGVAGAVAEQPHPERLERNTRRLAALGARVPDGALAKARASEPQLAERLNRIFDRADVVLTASTPAKPPVIADVTGRGALWTLNRAALEVPYYGPWNMIGQPATSVPAGFDADGLPMSVQFYGRPADELTLLRLAAQLEEARPWAGVRPPVDGPVAVAA